MFLNSFMKSFYRKRHELESRFHCLRDAPEMRIVPRCALFPDAPDHLLFLDAHCLLFLDAHCSKMHLIDPSLHTSVHADVHKTLLEYKEGKLSYFITQ